MNKLKIILTNDTTKLSLKTIGYSHLIAQRFQTTWRVSKNKITGEIGTMSLDKIWEIINETK